MYWENNVFRATLIHFMYGSYKPQPPVWLYVELQILDLLNYFSFPWSSGG